MTSKRLFMVVEKHNPDDCIYCGTSKKELNCWQVVELPK
jgi:thioredoxin-related protein